MESFQESGLEHGYAYPPTLLYIISALWMFNVWAKLDIPTAILWKIPILFADIGILLAIFRSMKNSSYITKLIASAFWVFNPFFIARYEYTSFEMLLVLFLLLSLNYLGKEDSLAGLFYGLSVSFKFSPVVLLPLVLYHSKSRYKFLFWVGIVFVSISISFVFSKKDFVTYLRGSYLVHSERQIQGRPLLSYLSYISQGAFKPYQNEFVNYYSFVALLSGHLITVILIRLNKAKRIYAVALMCFSTYFVFTPVLNRSHFLWLFPFIILGVKELIGEKNRVYPVSLLLIYIVVFTYLWTWNKGIEPSKQDKGKVVLYDNINDSKNKNIIITLKNSYYDYRHRLFSN